MNKTGDERLGLIPETQYRVQVLHNIKGKLKGEVTVNQYGIGYKDSVFYAMENGSLLRPGGTYIFATRYNEMKDWHTISVPPYDAILLDDTDLPSASLPQTNSRVRELENAYQHEVPLEADAKHGNMRNSYQVAAPRIPL